MKKIFYLLLLIVLIAQTGCGPTVSNVLKKYESEFKEKRDQFRSIVNLLPPNGNIKNNSICKDIVPAMVFNERNKKYNTEIIMFEQLLDPDTKPEMDLFLSNDLLLAIQWTGTKSPLSPSILDDSGAEIEKTLKAALGYRYLVINRVAKLTKPEVKNETNYFRGQVLIETFIVDMVNNKPLCSFTSSADSPSDLSGIPISSPTSYTKKGKVRFRTEYVVNRAEPKEVQLQKAAYSIMWEEARLNVIASLQKLTNGEIEIEE
jgi:hypothetical protein